VRKETTAKKVWDAVVKHHQHKTQLIIVELAKLRQMHDDLALMGEVLPDDGYRATILGSLPTSYDTFLTAISHQISPMPYPLTVEAFTVGTTTIPARVITVSPPKIEPEDLMEIIGQEADRRAIKSGSSKKDEKDAAFAASAKFRGAKGGRRSNIECFNCKKRGHIKADCWAKGGGKEGEGPKGKWKAPAKKDSAATANADDDDDAAWMAYEIGHYDSPSSDEWDLFDDSDGVLRLR